MAVVKTWSLTVQQQADIIKLQNTKKANLTNFSYVVLLLCHYANSPHYSTFRRMPERTSSIASIFFDESRKRISVTVWPTEEKSRWDCAELAEMQKILRAVIDRMGNCSVFCRQNANSSTASAAGTVRALYCASSVSLAALCPAAGPDADALMSRRSANGSSRNFFGSGVLVSLS